MVAVDLNKDGIPDIAVASTDGNFLPVFTKPGGAMNAIVERSLGGVRGLGTLTADFNRDGIPDLAVLDYGPPWAAATHDPDLSRLAKRHLRSRF
jgi:hypothetical protein